MYSRNPESLLLQQLLLVFENWGNSTKFDSEHDESEEKTHLLFEQLKNSWFQQNKSIDVSDLANLLELKKIDHPLYLNAYVILCTHTLITRGHKSEAQKLLSKFYSDKFNLTSSLAEEAAYVAYSLKRTNMLIHAFDVDPSSKTILAYLIQSSLDSNDGSTALELLENIYIQKDLFYINSAVLAYSMLGENNLALSVMERCDFVEKHQALSKNRILITINSGKIALAIKYAKKHFNGWGYDLIIIKTLAFYSENKKQKQQIEQFLSKVERKHLSSKDIAEMNYTDLILTKPKIKIEEYVKQLVKVNNQKFEASKYDISQEIRFNQKLKKYYKTLNKKILNLKTKSNFSLTPIFIVGLPRSGTTLLETILLQNKDIISVGESSRLASLVTEALEQDIDSNLLEELRNRYFLAFRKKRGVKESKYVIDKMPHNFRFIPLIRKCFPEAKIILTQRNPTAVCLSNYETNFDPPGLGYSFNQTTLAQFFKLYMSTIEEFKKSYDVRLIEWSYDDFIQEPSKKMEALFEELKLNWSESYLTSYQTSDRIVSTASAMQIKKSINRNASKKWEPYLQHLPELKANLSQVNDSV